MTTVSSIDMFKQIGDEIRKFRASNMTFPTYEVLSKYDNDTLKIKIIDYRKSRFTKSSPISISTTYPHIVTEVQAIIGAYNQSSLPQTTLSTDKIKKLITNVLIHYDYKDHSVKKELEDYTFNALFPKLNTNSGYSNHIKEKDSFNKKKIKLGHLYEYINIENKIVANSESAIILSKLNKQPQPQRKLFSFLFYTDTDTDTELSFILSTIKTTPITFDIIKDAIINYLATYEYFYNVYLHTKDTELSFFDIIVKDKKQEKLEKYEIQFKYTEQSTDNFFAITDYNNTEIKGEGKRVHIAITDDYLNYKFCLGNNNSSSGFGNINHPYNKPSLSTFTSYGKIPCAVSYFVKWALAPASPKSLIATIWILFLLSPS